MEVRRKERESVGVDVDGPVAYDADVEGALRSHDCEGVCWFGGKRENDARCKKMLWKLT